MTNEEIFISNIMQETLDNWIDLSHGLIDDMQYIKRYDAIRKKMAEKLKEINQEDKR